MLFGDMHSNTATANFQTFIEFQCCLETCTATTLWPIFKHSLNFNVGSRHAQQNSFNFNAVWRHARQHHHTHLISMLFGDAHSNTITANFQTLIELQFRLETRTATPLRPIFKYSLNLNIVWRHAQQHHYGQFSNTH